MAGWKERGSQRMLGRYSHARVEVMRAALMPFWQSKRVVNVNTVNAPRTREHRERLNTVNMNVNVNTLNTAELTN
jgi:hypothetical protein